MHKVNRYKQLIQVNCWLIQVPYVAKKDNFAVDYLRPFLNAVFASFV